MIILNEAGYRAVPWKNGGGITREILREPPEPTAFDWRLSLAAIEQPGPFSCFAGYERTLLLVRGAGIELNFGAHGQARLDALGKLARFDGAWQTGCTLLDGPSGDLNLIVSQQRAESQSESRLLESPLQIPTSGWTETLVCFIQGTVLLSNNRGDSGTLEPVDVARCQPADVAITCTPMGTAIARLFIARVRHRGAKI